MRSLGAFLILFLAGILLPERTEAQYDFRDAGVIEVIVEVEKQTSIRFLYRESQLAGIRLTFRTDDERIFDVFREKLESYDLSLELNTERGQAVIFSKRNSRKTDSDLSIQGQVVDAKTGERLPYATLIWSEGGKRKGTASNSSGFFRIQSKSESSLNIRASYLGYESSSWTFGGDEDRNFEDITLRLQPASINNNEVIITGSGFGAFSDTTHQRYVSNGVLNPLGDNNTIRALQALPSVNTTTALNNGINVRGSSEDATVVLLDGITIYNQSHLFGLLDSFNSNALQTSGFYYDVTPARFQATPGATLSLITRTGSLNEFSGQAGISNTSAGITLEGPIKKGNSSWLISGRTSYMNQLNWFGTNDLIAFGLDVDRPQEVLADNLTDLDSRLVIPGDSDALFYDLHAKVYFEDKKGGRFIGSFYAGGDEVTQDAQRFIRSFDPSDPDRRFNLSPVQTNNNWNNYSGSLNYRAPVGSRVYSNAMLAFSIYNTRFSKDDFVYNRIDASNPGSPQVFVYELSNQSVFNELKADYSADIFFDGFSTTIGGSYQYFSGEYYEESFDRPGILTDYRSDLFDLYAQADINKPENISLNSGLRMHYYTNGRFLRLSPRIKLRFFEDRAISLGAGYSRNYQFSHRLSFYNVSSPDIWVISTEEQPPTSVDYLTAGLYIRPINGLMMQLEGYYKWVENGRLFDLNSQSLINTIQSSAWLANYTGRNRGLEFMIRYDHSRFQWTHAYTWSRALYTNPVITESSPNYDTGEYFYADWDRTHNYSSNLSVNIAKGWRAIGSLTLASGTPNRLYLLGVEQQERLDRYQRLDLGIEYQTEIGSNRMEINASVYNVTDERNPWYRELNVVIDNSTNRSRIASEVVDVYDLGIQPSFNITFWF